MENIDDDWESFLQNDGEMNDFQLNVRNYFAQMV